MSDRNKERPADDTRSAAELLPAVYAELRGLAAAMSGKLRPGQTLTPTGLVHEAYLRLVRNQDPGWHGRRHFFGAAAQAMREILIEQARRKASQKHGGGRQRVDLAEGLAWIEPPAEDFLALDEAIQRLQVEDARLAEIVQLRFYTGLTVEETASVVGGSVSTVKRDWRYARAWLARQLDAGGRPAGAEGADG
jgi:RNA polymerase sigma factor (TIGR02999 family)